MIAAVHLPEGIDQYSFILPIIIIGQTMNIGQYNNTEKSIGITYLEINLMANTVKRLDSTRPAFG